VGVVETDGRLPFRSRLDGWDGRTTPGALSTGRSPGDVKITEAFLWEEVAQYFTANVKKLVNGVHRTTSHVHDFRLADGGSVQVVGVSTPSQTSGVVFETGSMHLRVQGRSKPWASYLVGSVPNLAAFLELVTPHAPSA
jgi:hypothetical protein